MTVKNALSQIKKHYFVVTAIFLSVIMVVLLLTRAEGGNASYPLSSSTTNKNQDRVKTDSIVLGSGCFWGAEKRYEQIPGVISAISGYANGKNIEPTYKAITKLTNRFNQNNHAEVVQVNYNPNQVSLNHIIKHFFESHDPTQVNRQGNDIGTQYRSTILYTSQNQKEISESLANTYQQKLNASGYGKIATKITALDNFHPAEEYHQDYLKKNPNGYCPDHSTGVKFDSDSTSYTIDNSEILSGKQIVVLESEYCPYCKAFKEQIGNGYKGEIPLHYRLENQLTGLSLKTPTWATPTIYFIQDGKEIFANQGFMTPDQFYKALGLFKLGKDSLAYNVAFNDGTENRFCRKYDLFKNTGEGTFVDTLSGEPLFETKHRFNSGTGWLSFTRAVANSIIEIPDNRYGMQRIEVRAKKTNIHLGHVFEDGPNGARRFCINANVLSFKPKK